MWRVQPEQTLYVAPPPPAQTTAAAPGARGCEGPDGETGKETPVWYASRKEHERRAVARRRTTRARADSDAAIGVARASSSVVAMAALE